MNSSLKIGILGIVFCAIGALWLNYPDLASAFYAMRASQLLADAMPNNGAILCENPDASSAGNQTLAQLAGSVAEHALEFNPSNARASLIQARSACLTNQPDIALASYEIYLQSEPNALLPKIEYGLTLQAAGKIDAAAKVWI